MHHDSTRVLCQYHYDPLDLLVKTTILRHHMLQRFYCNGQLTTTTQGDTQHSILQLKDKLLALQQTHHGITEATLLATDRNHSVLLAGGATPFQLFAYTPYGYRPRQTALLHMLGFNGEQPDPVTGHYLLGNGYRTFNPVLMRFNSPDSWSPFGKGGINTYSAFNSDPINKVDPTGHAPLNFLVLKAASRFKRGLPISKKHAISASNNRQTLKAISLKNKHANKLKKEISSFSQNKEPPNIKTIRTLNDLSIISKQNYDYKFIFTDRHELIIGADNPNRRNLSHAILAELASSDRIISAGHIAKRNESIVLSNQSGHYFIPDIDTTGPVIAFLNELGIKNIGIRVHLLRNERDFSRIPPDYVP